jgi:iron complex outermembrane recepter protein
MKKVTIIAYAGVSFAAFISANSALAQVAEPVASETLSPEASEASDAIIVTARRRDEDLQDVPSVVNAVTSATIEKLNVRNFSEVQTLVPGLALSTTANGTGGNASLRGVNFDVNASGFNPTVEFYYNDAPVSSGVLLQSLFDVGQIEVLRGPQGTLRGRASPSGSVIFSTKRPDLYEAGGNVTATGNDIGTINFNGGLGVPIINGIAAVRVAGIFEESDGDRVTTINGAVDGRDPYSRTRAGRISLRVQPFESLTLDGSYQRLERSYRSFYQYASFSEVNDAAAPSPVTLRAEDRRSISAAPNRGEQTFNIYNAQAQFSQFGQRLYYVFQRYDQLTESFTTTDFANRFPTTAIGQDLVTRAKVTSHEVRLQNDERIGDIFDYVIGGLDIKTNSPSNLLQSTAVALPARFGGSLVTVARTPVIRDGGSHEQSLFGNLTAHIGDSLELSGGGRYINYKSSGALNVAGASLPDPDVSDDHVIYAASAKYNVSPDLMIYASTGTSYRPAINAVGNFNVRQSALERSFISIPPEKSQSYEIGFKSTLLDRRLRVNATAYHQDFTNYPYRVPNAGVYYVNYNRTPVAGGGVTVTPQINQFNFVAAVPVEVNGIEGEVNFSATRDWDIGLVASYSLGKIKNGLTACNDLDGDGAPDGNISAPTLEQLQAVTGADNVSSCRVTQRSSFQAPFSFSLTSEIRQPVSAHVDGYLRGLFAFQGRSQADPAVDYDDVGKYGLLNLFAGLRGSDGRWEVALFAKNLTNVEKAVTRRTPETTSYQELNPVTRTTVGTSTTSTYNIVTMTPPREFGLTARFNFGSR